MIPATSSMLLFSSSMSGWRYGFYLTSPYGDAFFGLNSGAWFTRNPRLAPAAASLPCSSGRTEWSWGPSVSGTLAGYIYGVCHRDYFPHESLPCGEAGRQGIGLSWPRSLLTWVYVYAGVSRDEKNTLSFENYFDEPRSKPSFGLQCEKAVHRPEKLYPFLSV
jgi:hypothetical protein